MAKVKKPTPAVPRDRVGPNDTVRYARIPKHISAISMTPEQYYGLKVHIKTIVAPGTPAFELNRLGGPNTKRTYHEWLSAALVEMGPKFFPGGAGGLVWPLDYDKIYNAVHQVVRVMSITIRLAHQREQVQGGSVVPGAAPGASPLATAIVSSVAGPVAGPVASPITAPVATRVATPVATPVGADVGVGVGEDVSQLNKDERYAEWEKEEQMMINMIEKMEDENPAEDLMEGMDAEPLELEGVLELMEPEMLGDFPDLVDENFD
ncbi:hypothetical protein L873DRAFT_1812165 [Choiromyces venosus 120613-1]|uniref:Uncharacterized protein n=1 Tax=Choiromyces venosus 120613-1 TaxID=1336337 RepID=A0A3N4JC58_9PEZI|nr:hypothetical protein L873DRAFT_1812165 [Choiromyces venosus 120613-1]